MRKYSKYKNGRKTLDKLTKNLGLILLATGVIGLSACSSKPSPWSQQSSSPWAKGGEVQEPADDAMAEQQSPYIDQAPMDESMAMEPMDAGADGMPYAEPVETSEPLPMQPAEMAEPQHMGSMMAGPAGDIAAQPPGYYAVQLVASSSMKNLKAFTRRYNLSDQWVAETMVNGKNWFVLLSGVYATREEANAALADARAKLDTRPWVRTVGSLQAVMVP